MFQISMRSGNELFGVPRSVQREWIGAYVLFPGKRLIVDSVWNGACTDPAALVVLVDIYSLVHEAAEVPEAGCGTKQSELLTPLRVERPSRPRPTSCAAPIGSAVIGPIVGTTHPSGPSALAATLGGSPGFSAEKFAALGRLDPTDFLVVASTLREIEYSHVADDLTVTIRARRIGDWGIDMILITQCA